MIDYKPQLSAITPSDAAGFTDARGNSITAKGLLIGTDGAISVTWATGVKEVIPMSVLGTGVIHNVEIQRIWASGTTATNIYCGFDVRV